MVKQRDRIRSGAVVVGRPDLREPGCVRREGTVEGVRMISRATWFLLAERLVALRVAREAESAVLVFDEFDQARVA